MSELTDRIAQVLIAHPDKTDGSCCGEMEFDSQEQWAAHAAAAIVAELEADYHWTPKTLNPGFVVMQRYEWTADE